MPVTSSSVPPSGRNTSKSSADSGSTTHSLPRALTSEPTANAMAISSLSTQEPARLARPGDESRVAGASDADVEQLSFLLDEILAQLRVCLFRQYCRGREIVIRGVNHEDALELKSFGTVHGAEADHRRLRKLLSTQTMPRHASAFKPRLDHVQQIRLTRKHSNVIRRAPDLQQLADLCRYKVTLLRSGGECFAGWFRAGEQTHGTAP